MDNKGQVFNRVNQGQDQDCKSIRLYLKYVIPHVHYLLLKKGISLFISFKAWWTLYDFNTTDLIEMQRETGPMIEKQTGNYFWLIN